MQKNKKSFAWLGFVLLLIVAGLSYLRVRKLQNEGKHGKEILIDFIPGVGDLLYAAGGIGTKYEPIASDTQHGYMRNTAASMKELKQLEEQEKRAELAASKPAHAPIKRPKELSVNHAAFTASQAAGAGNETAASSVKASAAAAGAFAAGTVSRDQESKAASPFKPLEGNTSAASAKPAPMFKTKTSRNDDGKIMSSAFKPSTSSHTTDKIVTSAFKPSEGSHTTDKIVTSALKQTNKFTPQKGPSSQTKVESDSIKLARERAEAAREQQAMREAMKASKSAPETKAAGTAAPAKQHAPIKRPSAFSVNRAAAVAAAGSEAVKPAGTGASLGVGASAAEDSKPGPSISAARAKASSNSNQLGNMLNGKSHNVSGRAPVWAAPGTAGFSPFKQTEEAVKEAEAEAEMAAQRRAAVEEEAPKASYADQAKSHKSAFFSRPSSSREVHPVGADDSSNAYGGIVRPTGFIGEKDRKQQAKDAAMGSVLEGQKPAILDPNSHSAPTAVKPVFGFKPIDPEK